MSAPNGNSEPEWLLPIDLAVDSYAPEQIAYELRHRHAPYLREAQRLALDGLVPDRDALTTGIQAETRRYLTAQPWLAHPAFASAVAAVEGATLAALEAVVGAGPRPTTEPARVPAPRPVKRLTLQPSATIVGNMAIRKKPTDDGIELSWDAAPGVAEWTVRVSVRPDPRQDYIEGELATLPLTTTRLEVTLDELPRRIQVYGVARDGRILRRAVVSALTSGNRGSQWKRLATAS